MVADLAGSNRIYGKCGFNFEEHLHSTTASRQKLSTGSTHVLFLQQLYQAPKLHMTVIIYWHAEGKSCIVIRVLNS